MKKTKKIFTILHTNDLHSSFIGMGPASDYNPLTLNDDKTRGGYARLSGLITMRREARKEQGPVLVLDAGDFSMGTPFGAASREIGSELQLMFLMCYDATTFGNHEFDLGPEGLGKAINIASKAGKVPAVLSANINLESDDSTLNYLKNLTKEGVIKRYQIIERGGIKFGIFGVIGNEAVSLTVGKGKVKFSDPIQSANDVVTLLRKTEKVDVVIALSHGGLQKGPDGSFTSGEDVKLAEKVPGIDVVLSAHSHTEIYEPIIVNGRTPVVQTGKESDNLGELVISLDGDKLAVDSYMLHPINAAIAGDKKINNEIENFKKSVSKTVFASRGYTVDQPLAVAPHDLMNTFTDIKAGTILANLCTDAFRYAANSDIGFTVNGLMRASILRGKTGIQTVYDIFALAPLGGGIVDSTAGSALVTGYFTGKDLKSLLDYFLVDNPTHPGEWFPRTSGMKFYYDLTRPQYNAVTAIELGDFDHGYTPIEISGKDEKLYSLTCPIMLGPIIMALSPLTKGKLTLVPKNKEGQPLTSRVEALDLSLNNSPYLITQTDMTDKNSLATVSVKGVVSEIKEWQAIMDYLRNLPVKSKGELPIIPVDERAAEVRAIKEV